MRANSFVLQLTTTIAIGLLLGTGCPEPVTDAGSPEPSVDGGSRLDAGSGVDAGDAPDAGPPRDAGQRDGGPLDDAGRIDSGPNSVGDAGVSDAGVGDAGVGDAGVGDAGPQVCADTCELDVIPRRATLGIGPPLRTEISYTALLRPPGLPPEIHRESATWRSLNPSVATVSADGNVRPIAEGTTFIEATVGNAVAYGRVKVAGTVTAETLTFNGEARNYVVYVPSDIQTPAPLVMGLHGGGGAGGIQMDMSQLARPADLAGFIAVFPTGSGVVNTWNAGTCCGPAQSNEADDVAFLLSVLADVQAQYDIDDTRIYSTGFSNGAMMTHRLACEASDTFAAVAAVGGGLNVGGDFALCAPTRPVPMMMVHGTTDTAYPYEGGPSPSVAGETFHPIEHPTDADTLSDWQAHNSTVGPPQVVYDQGHVQCRRWTGAAPIELCRVDTDAPQSVGDVVFDGAGHAWPGGAIVDRAAADVPTQDLQAAERVWNFLRVHSLP